MYLENTSKRYVKGGEGVCVFGVFSLEVIKVNFILPLLVINVCLDFNRMDTHDVQWHVFTCELCRAVAN